MNEDFLSKLTDIIKDKIAKFTASNPDKTPFADGAKHTAEEITAGAMNVIAPETADDSAEKSSKRYSVKPIADRVRSELVKPSVRFELVASQNISVFESKVGGLPYMPKDFEYPKGVSGTYENRPLRFLAQLNFEKLPHIEDFPKSGIIQFFCSDDSDKGIYGADFNAPTIQNGFRVIYHKDIITDESQLCSLADIPDFDEDGCFPVIGEFILVPSAPENVTASIFDLEFGEPLCKYCSELCGEEISNYDQLSEVGFDEQELDDLFCEDDSEEMFRSCIGGYPAFTQEDPRFTKDISDCDILLFQLNSFFVRGEKSEIMWGDMGIANFFIPSENLKKCDFSRVVYNWDCT